MEAYTRNRSLSAKIESKLTRLESMIASISMVIMLVLSLLEIILRNFFHTGIPGASILIQYLVLWVSFFGAILAVRERHIKIDVAIAFVNDIWRRRLERPIFLFSTLVCGILFWHASRFWWDEWLSSNPDERWVAALGIIFPVTFFLLMLHFALRAIIGPRSPKRNTQ